jgi:hypothetical protein
MRPKTKNAPKDKKCAQRQKMRPNGEISPNLVTLNVGYSWFKVSVLSKPSLNLSKTARKKFCFEQTITIK